VHFSPHALGRDDTGRYVVVASLSGFSFRLPFRHDDRPNRIQRMPARKGLVGDNPF
jgi:hypothetical protein